MGQGRGGTPRRLVCLLRARNAAQHIEGWLDSARHFADAVVALDDGSTDDTAARLEADPLVEILLRTPAGGPPSAAPLRRLVDAAAPLEPAWVIWLEPEERLDPDDADALRAFVVEQAIRGCAYGLQRFRAWGEDRCRPCFDYAHRLVAWSPGLAIDDPDPGARVPTTIRMRRFVTTPGSEPSVRWVPRPPDLPALARAADPALHPARPPAHGPRLVCLLPARNAAEHLDGWLAGARRFADAVVALDDGSTDDTAARLEADPLVEILLRNPRRESYAGWDDAANRNRLLAAAAALRPEWIISLDADEGLDPGDAAALRRFIATEAEAGVAYGFPFLRMIGVDGRYDQDWSRAFRLFADEPGQRLSRRALHLVPVPTSIPRHRYVETTLRIQHFGAATAERRRARRAKYAEADPDNRYQASYENLLDGPGPTRRLAPRAPAAPVLDGGTGPLVGVMALDDELAEEAPALSVVVISRDDEERIERAVRAVVGQECPEPFEVIVVTSGSDRTADIVRSRFPQVRLVELHRPALPGRARNAGLRVARGEFITFPGSHVELPPGSLAARLRAHRRGHPLVTGAVHNGNRTRAGWAAYFLDHSTLLPARPAAALAGPPTISSYVREQLEAIGGFPEDRRAGEDTAVNVALFRRGLGARYEPRAAIIHHSPSLTARRMLLHHFRRGRGMARILAERCRDEGGLLDMGRRSGPGYVRGRLAEIDRNVAAWGGELAGEYARVRRLVAAAALAYLVGTAWEALRPRHGKLRILAGRAPETALDRLSPPPAPAERAVLASPPRPAEAAEPTSAA